MKHVVSATLAFGVLLLAAIVVTIALREDPGAPEVSGERGPAADPSHTVPDNFVQPPESTPTSVPSSRREDPDPGIATFIAGHVVVGDPGSPLADADVQVRLSSGTRVLERRFTTGRRGEFRLDGLTPGDYRLELAHADFTPARASAAPRVGRPVSDLRVVFHDDLVVYGTVRDTRGRPLAGAVVEWSRSRQPGNSTETVTDSDGNYRLRGLAPGRYLVRVMPEALRAVWRESRLVNVTLRAGMANRLDFTRDLGASLRVIVTGRNGDGLEGVPVRFRLTTPGGGISGVLPPTDGTGTTVAGGLPRDGVLTLEAAVEPRRGNRLEIDLASPPTTARLMMDGDR